MREGIAAKTTVAHDYHHNYKLLTAKPKRFTAKPNSLQQNKNACGKTKQKMVTAKIMMSDQLCKQTTVLLVLNNVRFCRKISLACNNISYLRELS